MPRLIDAYKVRIDRDDFDTYSDYITALDAVTEAPTVDAEPNWIPVSEKLPDEFDEYMCTCIDKYTARLYTSAVEFCPSKKNPWVTSATVIAWLEHPKPYEVNNGNS